MLKFIAPAVLAAFIVYDVTVAPGLAGMVETSAPQRALKGDRLPIGPACSQAAWPHYESMCVRNRTQPTDQPQQVRQVRIVSADRLSSAQAELADRCDCHH